MGTPPNVHALAAGTATAICSVTFATGNPKYARYIQGFQIIGIEIKFQVTGIKSLST